MGDASATRGRALEDGASSVRGASAIAYVTIRDIVGLWGATPTRESVLADHVDLARYRGTFPTWSKKLRKKMRKAAGVRPPSDRRLA